MVATRLKVFLPELISNTQSAFVPGWIITDNVMVIYECLHRMKKKKGKMGLCAVKLDMHKAYDRVEWCFLRAILLRMGFSLSWIDLVMQCVTTIKISCLI